MKPDEEMHAGAEEIELEPSDFFIDIATLIIEGRVPGLTDKGFGEGPHCRPLYGQNRHVCDSASPDCQQYEQLEKHMLLLWKNGIPMSVEVLLYPDCCQPIGRNVQVETSSVPESSSCTLLEQWTLHMPQRRIPDASIVPKGLLQAVRSFLHFSQLSAWLSLGKGKIKTNIHYRICVPGEAFSTKFERHPDAHTFPVSNVGRSHAMKVMVKSLPRQGEFPKVPCLTHGVGLVQPPSNASASVDNVPLTQDTSGNGVMKTRDSYTQCGEGSRPLGSSLKEFGGKFCNSSRLKDLSCKYPEMNAKRSSYGIKSPVSETSLGDCLLDPPQSLLMYPKRYQSPSRCGSPSLEVPEHLMFGLGASAASSSKPEAHNPAHLHSTPKVLPSHSAVLTRDRSRPQRRPVVERFLKKQYGVASPTNPINLDCDRLKHMDEAKKQHLEEICKVASGTITDGLVMMNSNSHFPGKYPPKDLLDDGKLPNDEMRLVLDRLRQRYPASKLSLMPHFEESKQNTNDLICESYLLKSIKCKTISSEQECNKKDVWKLKGVLNGGQNVKKHCTNSVEPRSSVSKDNQWFRDHILPNCEKGNKRTRATMLDDSIGLQEKSISPIPCSFDSSFPSSPPYQNHSNTTFQSVDSFNDKESLLNPDLPAISHGSLNNLKDQEENAEMRDLMCILDKNCNASIKMEEDLIDEQFSSSEIIPEALPAKEDDNDSIRDLLLNNSQSISASKRMLGRNFAFLYYKMLKSNLNLPMQDDTRSESPDKNGHLIPSAAEKLKFRRSLDSATCMVFHQNTGLPLTSSPAPVRKSGTCFDFDSSLTSVSAIKKALFENDPEFDEEMKQLMSSSAPASTTTSNLLGNFEESVLNGRLEPVSTVEGFTAEIGASGSFCPRHKTLPVTVFFYTLHDIHKVTSPYLGHINLGRKGYNIPKKGTVQVTLFNPHRTVVKMFVVRYDLSDMPPCSQTFVRQRTLYMPTGASEDDEEARKWLRYLIHLRFASSKSGKIYLHTDVRMIVFRKSDLDAATIHGQCPYELRSFTQGPKNPKFSPCK